MQKPLLLINFNRPALTTALIKRLESIRPQKLYLACDAARSGREGEAKEVEAVRQILAEIPWACHVERLYASENMGCRARVSSAISWVLEQEDEAIILEDDCFPDPTFFRFCEELLEHYRHDTRIGSICGSDFSRGAGSFECSYYFSRYNHYWGWATWKRAWRHYDDGMSVISDGTLDALLQTVFPRLRERLYWKRVMMRVHEGRINSWGYRWELSCWAQNMLGVMPTRNLVTNLGFGNDATHTANRGLEYQWESVPMGFPLRHPRFVLRNLGNDQVIEDSVYSKDLRGRILWAFARFLVPKWGR